MQCNRNGDMSIKRQSHLFIVQLNVTDEQFFKITFSVSNRMTCFLFIYFIESVRVMNTNSSLTNLHALLGRPSCLDVITFRAVPIPCASNLVQHGPWLQRTGPCRAVDHVRAIN